MKAAVVVDDFREPPRYTDFPDPVPAKREVEVEVVAAALHPLVKTLADGSHWYSPSLPFVPGLDGVGRTRYGR